MQILMQILKLINLLLFGAMFMSITINISEIKSYLKDINEILKKLKGRAE